MSTFGYGSGGQAGFGPSRAYLSLPFRGYREVSTWVEEFIDAIGYELDYRYFRFIRPQARANMLDPTYTPIENVDANMATATSAPTTAASQDSMLDVLAYIALGQYPLDSNLSVAQKQALVKIGWTALRRKGTRRQQLNLASQVVEGVVYGFSVPPNSFSIIVPDGATQTGYGTWVPGTAAISETTRPWALSSIRSLLSQGMFPDWASLGVGFAQFRAGYSAAGETSFSAGSRINLLANEHHTSWTSGTANNWAVVGTVAPTQDTAASYLNWEFTGSAAKLDMSAAAISTIGGYTQTTAVNNQITHRAQIDYQYTNSQSVGVLRFRITDVTNGQYYNPTTATWGSTVYDTILPPSTTRTRYSTDVVMQPASNSALISGTSQVAVQWSVVCDGTATTKVAYEVYRVGLYEKFDTVVDAASFGERTLWLPLVDASGWSTTSRTGGGNVVLEPAAADRSSYKAVAATAASFPYEASIGKRGFLATSTWTNLLKGSNDFGADWTLTTATRTANATISPLVGETVASASNLTATSTGAKISQATGLTPTSKVYCGGVWVKKLSTDGTFTDVTLSLVSTSTKSVAFALKQAQGWQLLPFSITMGSGDVAAMSMQIAWGAASSSGQIAVASAYLYDVTSNPKVLYPPVCQTAIGATGIVKPTTCLVTTQSPGINILHPLTQRPLASVIRGSFGTVLSPTFDASSQPNGVIFDVAQGAAQNRVVMRVNSGALEIRRWDNTGNQWFASLTLANNPVPASGSATWLRDTAITVRAVWDEQSTQLSVGNGNASGTKPGSWAPDDTFLTSITIGNDFNGANQFDGCIADA